MRRLVLFVISLAALTTSYLLGRLHNSDGHSDQQTRKILYYVDSMHPSYRSSHPGIAPDCGMALTPVYADPKADNGLARQSHAGTVLVDADMQRAVGIAVEPAQVSGAVTTLRVAGRVVPEDTRIYHINTGVEGFIRETFNDSIGVPVAKDQTLAAYYSPEFLTAASGFLAASERIPGSVAAEGARSLQNYSDRLRDLGVSESQLHTMATTHKLPQNVDIAAPVNGIILQRSVSPGQHFEREMELYQIADLSRVWVVAEIDEHDANSFRTGAEGKVVMRDTGRKLPAHLTASLPEPEPGASTVKFRLDVPNPGLILRPGMVVDIELPVHKPAALTVPAEAILDSGSESRVYVETADGPFEPRKVTTGWRGNGRVEILSGLRPGEKVVTAGTFLIDSETRLQAPAEPSRVVKASSRVQE